MNRTDVENVLFKMGVPPKVAGFKYITDAVMILHESEDISMTKELYPQIAEKYGTSWNKVERAIRTAFKIARSAKADYEVVEHYIGFINRNNSSSLMKLCKELEREESVDLKSCNGGLLTEERVRQIIREELEMFLKKDGGQKYEQRT